MKAVKALAYLFIATTIILGIFAIFTHTTPALMGTLLATCIAGLVLMTLYVVVSNSKKHHKHS